MTSKAIKRPFVQGDVLTALDKIPDSSYSLIITSPPYNIGKEYEKDARKSLGDYLSWLDEVITKLVPKLTDHGSICWQVGNYINDGEVFPLDVFFYQLFKKHGLKLRNRIVWQFNFGLNSTKRLSGRYETLLWFTKSDDYTFNLDKIRVPQQYPGKRHPASKGDRAGKLSGNPLGKNPSDYWEFSAESIFETQSVWNIPNVKSNHPEKTIHPCQFPIELVERCVLAFTNEGEAVLDPFVGTGTSVIAAAKHNRFGLGIDKDKEYLKIAEERLSALKMGNLKVRPIGKPVHQPNGNEKVASYPSEWVQADKKVANLK